MCFLNNFFIFWKFHKIGGKHWKLIENWKKKRQFKTIIVQKRQFETFAVSTVEVSNKIDCKLDKIPRIFSVNSPHSGSSKFDSSPRRSKLVSDWLKFTRAWVETLHRWLFRISIMVCGELNQYGGGVTEKIQFQETFERTFLGNLYDFVDVRIWDLCFDAFIFIITLRAVLKFYQNSESDSFVTLLFCSLWTVASEKKGTFICELILERYIYLRDTQKHLRITNYVRNKSFLEFYLVYNGICLKLLGSLLWKLVDFAPLCIKMGGWFCVTTFDVLSTFYSVSVFISYTLM